MSTENKSEPSTISFSLLLPRLLSIFLVLLPLLITLSNTPLLQQSDFLSAFYLAGRLVLCGRPLELYVDSSSTSLMTTPFNAYAHQTLPHFPPAATAAYMYPPLTALVFAPLAALPLNMAFLVWQIITILALGACAYLIARISHKSWSGLFCGSVLFLPVAQNLLLGQLGIVLGLLPLCLGYCWLVRGHPIRSGLIWSLLWLKPQFLPVAVLIAVSLALAGKYRCAISFLTGAAFLTVVSFAIFGPEVFRNWLLMLKMAGTIYSDPRYNAPNHLLSALSPAVTQLLPLDWRAVAKPILSAVSLVVGCHALWFCRRLVQKAGDQYATAISFVFVICILLLPLILPYLLIYDLSIIALAGMIIYGQDLSKSDPVLKRDLVLALIFVDVYLLVFMFAGPKLVQPLFLVLVLGLVYRRVLLRASAWANSGSGPLSQV